MERHRLRIRTVAVSFAAAVSSARNDLETTPAERDALIEVWRAWSLDTLERYRDEIVAIPIESDGDDGGLRRELLQQLRHAVDSVRGA